MTTVIALALLVIALLLVLLGLGMLAIIERLTAAQEDLDRIKAATAPPDMLAPETATVTLDEHGRGTAKIPPLSGFKIVQTEPRRPTRLPRREDHDDT